MWHWQPLMNTMSSWWILTGSKWSDNEWQMSVIKWKLSVWTRDDSWNENGICSGTLSAQVASSYWRAVKSCHQIQLPETTVQENDTLSGKIHQLTKILKYSLVSPSSCPPSVSISCSSSFCQHVFVTLSCVSFNIGIDPLLDHPTSLSCLLLFSTIIK